MTIKVSDLYDISIHTDEQSKDFGDSIAEQCKDKFGININNLFYNENKEFIYENLQTWKSEEQMNDPWVWPFAIVRRLDIGGSRFYWGETQITELISSIEA
jgi:hypothetical protein